MVMMLISRLSLPGGLTLISWYIVHGLLFGVCFFIQFYHFAFVACPYSLYKFTMLCFPFPYLYILASPFGVYNHWLYLRISPLVAWPEWLVRVGAEAL